MQLRPTIMSVGIANNILSVRGQFCKILPDVTSSSSVVMILPSPTDNMVAKKERNITSQVVHDFTEFTSSRQPELNVLVN